MKKITLNEDEKIVVFSNGTIVATTGEYDVDFGIEPKKKSLVYNLDNTRIIHSVTPKENEEIVPSYELEPKNDM